MASANGGVDTSTTSHAQSRDTPHTAPQRIASRAMSLKYDAPAYDQGLFTGKHRATATAKACPAWTAFEEVVDYADDGDGVTTENARGDVDEGASSVKFDVRKDLNAIVRVYECVDPWLLEVDVITCSANEQTRRQRGKESAMTRALHEHAGGDLEEEMKGLDRVRTGDCAMTSAYRLPARRIAHVVGPRYADKYATAAENALCHCYRSALNKMVDELKYRTIAFTTVCDESKKYPRDDAAMVAARTVRRFLERWSGKLDAAVFCVNAADKPHFVEAMKVFFPRNATELAHAETVLQGKEYNEYGELVLSERRMRIDAFPGRTSPSSNISSGGFNTTLGVKMDDECDASVVPAVSSVFMSMNIDPESRRQRKQLFDAENDGENWWNPGALDTLGVPGANLDSGLTVDDKRNVEVEHSQRISLLKRAQSMDVSDVNDARAIYLETSRDYIGRRIVVVVAAFLERMIKAGEEQRLLAHVAKELRGVTDNPRGYVIVYHHAGGAYGAPPSLDFIRQLHIALGPQHKDTLKAVFVVHPTAVLKAAIWAMDLLRMESRLCSKVDYVDTVCDLHEYVRLENKGEKLDIPDHVDQYDRERALVGQTLW